MYCLFGLMWKLAALASLALCAAQTPAAPDATTGKAAPNVTVTEARPAPQAKRTRVAGHTALARSAGSSPLCARAQTKIDSPVADIQWVGKDKKVRTPHAPLCQLTLPGRLHLMATCCPCSDRLRAVDEELRVPEQG